MKAKGFIPRGLILFFCALVATVASVEAVSYVEENNRAVVLLEQGRYLEGLDLLKESFAAAPYEESIRQNLLHGYLAAGRSLRQQEQFSDLVQLMSEAQAFDDSRRDFWSLRGYALLRLKEYDAAEVDLQEARVMGDPDVRILLLLGKLYYQTDRLLEAVDLLESALLYEPSFQGLEEMLDKVRRELAVEQEMDREYGGHFVISYDGEKNYQFGGEVLDLLEEAYLSLGSLLDYYPQNRVTVILYTRQQFSDLTESPDWAGGLYDGKIRLPVGGIQQVMPRLRMLLYHEYMHVILRDIAGQNLPTWLNEGLAVVAETEAGVARFEGGTLAEEQQQLFGLGRLENSFTGFNRQQSRLAYRQSYSLVQFLIEEYGWHHVRELLFALAKGSPIAEAFAQAYSIYGISYADFEDRWQLSVRFE